MDLLAAADLFAARSHAEQVRKGTGRPYIEHPRDVASLLAEAGASAAVVAAGLLHDTVEDTAATAAEVEAAFGSEIAGLVAAVSEDKSRSWEERKRHGVRQLATAPEEILLLTAADKLSNARALVADGEGVWARFNRPYGYQRRYYRAATRELERRAGESEPLAQLVGDLREVVDSLFPPDPPLAIDELVVAVHGRSTGLDSHIHGERHWLCVGATGLELCEREPLADPLVVLCFALLHDAMRVNDGGDPDHGRRAAVLARALEADGLLPLARFQLDELEDALARHADGEVTSRPTTGACWDADRLHLPRVGTTPRPELLSGPIGNLELAIARAGAVREQPPGWVELHAAVRARFG